MLERPHLSTAEKSYCRETCSALKSQTGVPVSVATTPTPDCVPSTLVRAMDFPKLPSSPGGESLPLSPSYR